MITKHHKIFQGLPCWLHGKEFSCPMQETQVLSLTQEDPTCHRATKPRKVQPLSLSSRAREPQLLSPRLAAAAACVSQSPFSATRDAATGEARSPQPESSPSLCDQRESTRRREDPEQPRINEKTFKMPVYDGEIYIYLYIIYIYI